LRHWQTIDDVIELFLHVFIFQQMLYRTSILSNCIYTYYYFSHRQIPFFLSFLLLLMLLAFSARIWRRKKCYLQLSFLTSSRSCHEFDWRYTEKRFNEAAERGRREIRFQSFLLLVCHLFSFNFFLMNILKERKCKVMMSFWMDGGVKGALM